MSYNKESEYNKWLKQVIKDKDFPPMTNTQCNFAKFLFEEENFNMLSKIGDLDSIYKSIRKYLKP